MTTCLFCKSQKFSGSPFEDTVFNNKRFRYITCQSCGLVQVDPLPDLKDYEAMYSDDLGYYQLRPIAASSEFDDMFSDIRQVGAYQTFLDFGCGNGKYLVNALDKGYKVTATDFGTELIEKLTTLYPDAAFLEINDFYKSDQKYDVILVSNVFEHLTNPVETLDILVGRLNDGGVIVSRGPIENNFTFAGVFRKFLFGTRKILLKKTVSHTPKHIFYSNYQNQLDYFVRAGLTTQKYDVGEGPWPFPESYQSAAGIKGKLFWLIGSISMTLSPIIPKSGNHFLYIGRKG